MKENKKKQIKRGNKNKKHTTKKNPRGSVECEQKKLKGKKRK